MSRYKDTEQKKGYNSNTKMSYATTIYNEVPERDDDMYFIAVDGDRCDNLAQQFYGDPTLWWFVAKINNLYTMNIPAGTSLRIPISEREARGF
tara:strand:- start:25 stop:303 length:279 start_codon:yes stop_codon:yes gene_type:complete